MASTLSSLYRVIFGILSKTIRIILSLAASLGNRSACSFPRLHAWALIHRNSVEKFTNSEVNKTIFDFLNKVIMYVCFLQRVNTNSALGVYCYRAGYMVRDF